MAYRIEKAAVLGAGTMGARIAAHLANAGVPCFLLDIVPQEVSPEEARRGLTLENREVRNRLALAGVQAALRSRPAAFFTPEGARLITAGNFEDDLALCGQADWIIEAVTENLEIKRDLLARVEPHRKPDAIVTTNTSGLPIHLIAERASSDLKKHWAGTHFFNPPRYLKLVELVPGPETALAVISALRDFCERRLGKGVVLAKDTPNFIANRIGTFSFLNAIRLMVLLDMTIEEVDACTGPALGWPKSATFRTADIVGLDVLANVVRNIHAHAPDDESREACHVPPLIEEMTRRGWLGDKTGQGFYKRVKKDGESEILALNWKTMDYLPRQKARLASLEAGKLVEDTRERLRGLLGPVLASRGGGDKAAQFLWGSISQTCLYAARRIPEIAERVVEVDRAMSWGFGWELGPFEMWDALGVERMAKALERDAPNQPAAPFLKPPLLEKLQQAGGASFYRQDRGQTSYFDLATAAYQPLEEAPGLILLKSLKERSKTVQANPDASLIDLGDGVLCCEFHAKMNAIGADLVAMLNAGLARLETEFEAMVIANQAANFSVGANLLLILMSAQEEEWDDIDLAVRQFQKANMSIKYAPRPVVVAPQGMALGGGCEIILHGARIHAAAEAYIGLVETGVGLIPAGGGTKEMLIRANERARGGPESGSVEADLDLFHALKPIFETIAMAKVSTSAEEARTLGFLRRGDLVAMNRDRLVADAKESALAMVRAGYHAPVPAQIRVLGQEFLSAAKLAIHMLLRGEYISDYDAEVARQLASVLAGGPLSAPQYAGEQYVLDLEREAFVSLCGQRKTQERMAHTLKTGKPLRN